MSTLRCAINPAHGPATITFERGAVVLCSGCAKRYVEAKYELRRPVALVGGRRP